MPKPVELRHQDAAGDQQSSWTCSPLRSGKGCALSPQRLALPADFDRARMTKTARSQGQTAGRQGATELNEDLGDADSHTLV